MFEVRLDDLMTLPGFKFYHPVEIVLLEINGSTHMLKFKHLYKHLHESGCYSAHSHKLFFQGLSVKLLLSSDISAVQLLLFVELS